MTRIREEEEEDWTIIRLQHGV